MDVLFTMIALQAASIENAVKRAIDENECMSRTNDDLIVVCGQREKVEPYRLPNRAQPFDVRGNVMSVMRERMAWGDGGDTGIQSCGPVGPGGYTGCLLQSWKKNDQQNPRRR